MKKSALIIVCLISMIFATTAIAKETYTAKFANKYIQPVARKEQALNDNIQGKRETAKTKQKAQEEAVRAKKNAIRAKQEEQKNKVETKKKQLKDLTTY